MADPEVEVCIGCDRKFKPPETYNWVGVTRDEDGMMASFPVCDDCHVDPHHRKYTLKMHFFPKGHAATAVDAAERNILVEGGSSSQRRKK